jgi:hypothetical protein
MLGGITVSISGAGGITVSICWWYVDMLGGCNACGYSWEQDRLVNGVVYRWRAWIEAGNGKMGKEAWVEDGELASICVYIGIWWHSGVYLRRESGLKVLQFRERLGRDEGA